MASQIDATKPADNGALISKEIRDNFVAAKSEIEALQNNSSGASLNFTALGAMRMGGDDGAATEGPGMAVMLNLLATAAAQVDQLLRSNT